MPIHSSKSKLAIAIQASMLGLCQPISAATINVSVGGDNPLSDCTFREALTSINLGAGNGGCSNSSANPFGVDDTVTIAPILTGSTITLQSGTLFINEDVHIEGGDSGLTINAGDQSRVLRISSATVTMDSLTILNGNAGFNYYGGGIYAVDSDVTLNSGALSGNSAQSGGAIMANRSSFTVNASDISSNEAREGGGILIRGTPTTETSLHLSDSTISNNTANQNDGGGVYSDYYVNIIVENSTFTSNSATSAHGGAIASTSSKLTISGDSVFSNNIAGDEGGAIFATRGFYDYNLIDIKNTSFSDNSAVTGGAITISGMPSATLDSISISANAAAFGAGLFARTSTLTVTNSDISQNTASNSGGGISMSSSTVTLEETSVFSNTAGTGTGGGLRLSGNGASLDIIASTVANNTAGTDGGGLSLSMGTEATATNSTFSGNRASGKGGGTSVGFASATFKNSTFSNNTALDAGGLGGGGLYSLSSVISISNTIIANSPTGMDCESVGGSTISTDTQSIIEQDSCGASATNIDPQLLSLADNGGPTLTHALADGSPARDAGDNTHCEATDQRGEPRDDSACDVGAFELQEDDFVAGDETNFIVIPLANGRTVVIPN